MMKDSARKAMYAKSFKTERDNYADKLKQVRNDPRVNYWGGKKGKQERIDYLSYVVKNFDELLQKRNSA